MRDLLPPVLLVVGLLCVADARADDELMTCLRDRAERTERLAGCLDESAALERERDALRARVRDLEASYQSVEDLQMQARRQRTVAVVAGLLGGAAMAYGSVWVAGRLR